MGAEEANALEDAVDDVRQLVGVEVVLHLQILLAGPLVRVDAVHANLVRYHREITEVGQRTLQLSQHARQRFLIVDILLTLLAKCVRYARHLTITTHTVHNLVVLLLDAVQGAHRGCDGIQNGLGATRCRIILVD